MLEKKRDTEESSLIIVGTQWTPADVTQLTCDPAGGTDVHVPVRLTSQPASCNIRDLFKHCSRNKLNA